MHRNGPIALWLHGMVEYLAAAACFFAPFVLDFGSDAATYFSIAAGVAILLVAATTDGPASIVSHLPIGFHVLLDYVVALAFIAAPFVFSFSDERAPTAFFIGLGVLHLLVTVGTRFYGDDGAHGISPLAASTSVDVESGQHTVLDD
ncbi:MAG: hypothetical protein JWM86_1814 [Thermoleophilia bacterium]|nr:hypothetical protein [Thermoleophilia bacterium]